MTTTCRYFSDHIRAWATTDDMNTITQLQISDMNKLYKHCLVKVYNAHVQVYTFKNKPLHSISPNLDPNGTTQDKTSDMHI